MAVQVKPVRESWSPVPLTPVREAGSVTPPRTTPPTPADVPAAGKVRALVPDVCVKFPPMKHVAPCRGRATLYVENTPEKGCRTHLNHFVFIEFEKLSTSW